MLFRSLEKATLGEGEKQLLNEVLPPLQMLGKMNIDGNYFMFPLWTQGEIKEGEVYFFKPHSKKKSANEEMYIVVSLDMVALEHIEVHIRKQQQNLYLALHVASEDVQKVVEGKMVQLQETLSDMGFHLLQCKYHLPDEAEAFSLGAQLGEAVPIVQRVDLKV